MCLSRGIIKRVARDAPPPSDDRAAKSGIMSRTRGSSADLPRPPLRANRPSTHTSPPFRPPPTYPYTRVRRRFRLLIKTRVREGFQGFLPGSPPRGRGRRKRRRRMRRGRRVAGVWVEGGFSRGKGHPYRAGGVSQGKGGKEY